MPLGGSDLDAAGAGQIGRNEDASRRCPVGALPGRVAQSVVALEAKELSVCLHLQQYVTHFGCRTTQQGAGSVLNASRSPAALWRRTEPLEQR